MKMKIKILDRIVNLRDIQGWGYIVSKNQFYVEFYNGANMTIDNLKPHQLRYLESYIGLLKDNDLHMFDMIKVVE